MKLRQNAKNVVANPESHTALRMRKSHAWQWL
jgi:hypothetical protein